MKKTKGFALKEHPTDDRAGGDKPAPQTSSSSDPLDQLGELPFSYGAEKIFLVAQDPHWLFTYWDFDIARHPGGPAYLRYATATGQVEGEIEVAFETRNWYIPVQHAGGQYFVELGYYRDGQWQLIGRSAVIETPPQELQGDRFDCAVIPLHLRFDALLRQVEAAMRMGERLAETVSRIQTPGFSLPEDQLQAMQQAILGTLFESADAGGLLKEPLDSKVISDWIQRVAEEKIHSLSGSPSEQIKGLAKAESSPGSAFFSFLAVATTSEAVTSWTGSSATPEALAALGRWASLAFSSFESSASSGHLGILGEEMAASWSSFALGRGLSSWETFAGAPSSGSHLREAIRSWLGESTGSITPEKLSSWIHGIVQSNQFSPSSWGDSSSLKES